MKKSEYKGNLWHDTCFLCSDCKKPIGSEKFTHHNDDVVCMACHETNYAQRCCKCKEVI